MTSQPRAGSEARSRRTGMRLRTLVDAAVKLRSGSGHDRITTDDVATGARPTTGGSDSHTPPDHTSLVVDTLRRRDTILRDPRKSARPPAACRAARASAEVDIGGRFSDRGPLARSGSTRLAARSDFGELTNLQKVAPDPSPSAAAAPALTQPRPGRGGKFNVVIAGGGVAGIEAALCLNDIAGDRVSTTILSPNDDFVYLPTALPEPFVHRVARSYPLPQIAKDADAELCTDKFSWLDSDFFVVHTKGGEQLPYDALLLTPGASMYANYRHTMTLDPYRIDEQLGEIGEDIDRAEVRSLAFVIPDCPVWLGGSVEVLEVGGEISSVDVAARIGASSRADSAQDERLPGVAPSTVRAQEITCDLVRRA